MPKTSYDISLFDIHQAIIKLRAEQRTPCPKYVSLKLNIGRETLLKILSKKEFNGKPLSFYDLEKLSIEEATAIWGTTYHESIYKKNKRRSHTNYIYDFNSVYAQIKNCVSELLENRLQYSAMSSTEFLHQPSTITFPIDPNENFYAQIRIFESLGSKINTSNESSTSNPCNQEIIRSTNDANSFNNIEDHIVKNNPTRSRLYKIGFFDLNVLPSSATKTTHETNRSLDSTSLEPNI